MAFQDGVGVGEQGVDATCSDFALSSLPCAPRTCLVSISCSERKHSWAQMPLSSC